MVKSIAVGNLDFQLFRHVIDPALRLTAERPLNADRAGLNVQFAGRFIVLIGLGVADLVDTANSRRVPSHGPYARTCSDIQRHYRSPSRP